MVKNSNWQEADQLAIYQEWPRIWTRDYRETNPASDRVEALNPGPLDYNASALNHSTTLPPQYVYHNSYVYSRCKLKPPQDERQGIKLHVPLE